MKYKALFDIHCLERIKQNVKMPYFVSYSLENENSMTKNTDWLYKTHNPASECDWKWVCLKWQGKKNVDILVDKLPIAEKTQRLSEAARCSW